MAKEYSRWMYLMIMASLYWVTACSPQDHKAPAAQLPADSADAIKAATVQITMFTAGFHEVVAVENDTLEVVGKTVQVETDIARGIGSVVALGEAVLVVTHDHWPNVQGIEQADRVEFHDAEGRLLTELSGERFGRQILFKDSGTLVLLAPAGLLAFDMKPAELGVVLNLKVGDLVTLVKHNPGSPDRLALVDVRIQEISGYPGTPQMVLRTVQGESIEPGDSGGGIWIDGRLVGNLWMTIRTAVTLADSGGEPQILQTDQSIAAVVTGDLVDLLLELQHPLELPPPAEFPLS